MIFLDAMNIFSRKSRLASCTVSLASVSVAPKTPSSSTSSGSLEAVSISDACATVVHVEVDSGVGEQGSGSKDRPSWIQPRGTEKSMARHALLKCAALPLSTTSRSASRSRSSSTSGSRDEQTTAANQMRRKRSCSTSSVASIERESTVAFPTTPREEKVTETENGRDSVVAPPQPAHRDHQPPRKRARRSAVSVSRPMPAPPTRIGTSLASPQAISRGVEGSVSPPHSTSSSPSPSPPPPHVHLSAQLRFQASMYHTLILHQEMVAEMLQQSAQTPPLKASTADVEQLRGQDTLLIARLYFLLLLSAVPVMALPHMREQSHGEPFGPVQSVAGSSSADATEPGGLSSESNADYEIVRPFSIPEEAMAMEMEMEMDVDGDAVAELSEPQLSLTEELEGPATSPPLYAGPPFDSVSHMVAVMIFRHRAKLSRRSRHKPRPPKAVQSKSKKRLSWGIASHDEYTRSKLSLISVTREQLLEMDETLLDESIFARRTEMDGMEVDPWELVHETVVRSTHSWDEAASSTSKVDGDSDSESEEDKEWKVLRGELLAGKEPTVSMPIPVRPPSPVPSQLDDDECDKSPPMARRMPIRDVTNKSTSGTGRVKKRRSGSSLGAGSSSSRLRSKPPPALRKPVPKIKYPVHAHAHLHETST